MLLVKKEVVVHHHHQYYDFQLVMIVVELPCAHCRH